MVKLLQRALNACRNNAKDPWASFEVVKFEKDGRIKVVCSWNKQFIKTIHNLGFKAETDEDSVQLFFYTASMRPTELEGVSEDEAKSAYHPNLSSDTNVLKT